MWAFTVHRALSHTAPHGKLTKEPVKQAGQRCFRSETSGIRGHTGLPTGTWPLLRTLGSFHIYVGNM